MTQPLQKLLLSLTSKDAHQIVTLLIQLYVKALMFLLVQKSEPYRARDRRRMARGSRVSQRRYFREILDTVRYDALLCTYAVLRRVSRGEIDHFFFKVELRNK